MNIFQNIYQKVMQAMPNPMAIISKKYKIPAHLRNTKNGQEVVQYLLDSGQITQNQLNESVMEKNNNPYFKQFTSK